MLKAIPFFEQYPLWIRVFIAVWLASGGLLVAAIFYFHPGFLSTLGNSSDDSKRVLTTNVELGSHLEAIAAGVLVTDCTRFKPLADSKLYTTEQHTCEVFGEIRRQMTLIAKLREHNLNPSKDLSPGLIQLKRVSDFVRRDFSKVDYGPRKEKLLAFVNEVNQSISELEKVNSYAELQKWMLLTPMTLDDLFVGLGFLDWMMSYEAKTLIKPSEFVRMGPFLERPYPNSMQLKLRLRYFDFLGDNESGVEYLDVLSMFD